MMIARYDYFVVHVQRYKMSGDFFDEKYMTSKFSVLYYLKFHDIRDSFC